MAIVQDRLCSVTSAEVEKIGDDVVAIVDYTTSGVPDMEEW